MPFDYKKILLAYIIHVGKSEGTDFIGGTPWVEPMDFLTLEETQELNRLSDEAFAIAMAKFKKEINDKSSQ